MELRFRNSQKIFLLILIVFILEIDCSDPPENTTSFPLDSEKYIGGNFEDSKYGVNSTEQKRDKGDYEEEIISGNECRKIERNSSISELDCPDDSLMSLKNCPGKNILFYPDGDDYLFEHPYRIIFISKWKRTRPGEYCLDNSSEDNCTTLYYCRSIPTDQAYLAHAENISIMWSPSIPFLLLAALINSTIIQKNIPGLILTSHLISLFLAYSSSGLVLNKTGFWEPGCGVLEILQKFFFVNAYIWMTCLKFDIWFNFVHIKSKGVGRLPGWRRYFLYFGLSFIIPLVLVLFTLFVGDTIRGHRGHLCVLYDLSANYAIQIPLFPAVVFAYTLFGHTFWIIWRLKTQGKMARENHKSSKKSFTIFAKFFIITGPNWISRAILVLLAYWDISIGPLGYWLEVVNSSANYIFFLLLLFDPKIIKWAKQKMIKFGISKPDKEKSAKTTSRSSEMTTDEQSL